MLNLEYFQSLFGQESTEIRCRKVLDEISPAINRLFEGFIEQTGISLGNEYYIRNYDMTLSTTYHDSRNPTNAEKKKNSDIGKKYFVGLYRKVDEKEHNIFTLELNGFSELLLIHTDINLLPFWAWVKNESINMVLESIPSPYEIFTGWKEKDIIPKDELVSFVKGCVKSRKRPWFQVGRSLPLEAQIDEDTLVKHLFEVWENLSLFRTYLNDEINTSKRANEALGILASARSIKETELMGREYNLEITSLEDYKSNGKRQAFHLYDSDQLLTKGFLYYFEHHEKFSPFQTIMIQIEGHNHIFTNVREILGQGTKQWWITKSFTTHNLDNHQVMSEAMGLLNRHGIEAKGNEYRVGSFDNESRLFIEGNDQVKKNFIDAALLFAHASRKLELPSEEVSGSIEDIDKDTEPGISEDLEPNFRIEEIFQSILDSQFTFSKGIIRDLHLNLTALDDKHFVLLSGISGTGKTQLCRLYANAVYGLEYESENPYFTIIPVRPDWTDASALFGYYSSFEKRYVKTEFLEVILNALKEREKPHFILLDEMNLARVEYYLSDYLSAVESRKEIPLHQDNLITDIPKKILIPPNVYLLGTINVDETTHTISDKVLDRAFVMTLSDVDFETFWDKADQELKVLLEREFFLLKKLHNILLEFDLHFGYRTMNEMLQKLYANLQFPDDFQMDSLEALDRVISEKVLTKIRGDERVSDMLGKIEEWLKENLSSSSISLQHVERMQKELDYYGATQFWR
ncbi:McrB family protein [Cytobacillus oceanisediminis]|uniref:McrB family protein n=1 Tax=Cytobacillus oceanisediminis TaxID=665099 RepID=UPI001C2144CF|nr:AAA family ATPase [Cytobacillus oceanisediminis]MBU8769534.1 AAA family ATPase [Cytobacillus oceanisediminis]